MFDNLNSQPAGTYTVRDEEVGRQAERHEMILDATQQKVFHIFGGDILNGVVWKFVLTLTKRQLALLGYREDSHQLIRDHFHQTIHGMMGIPVVVSIKSTNITAASGYDSKIMNSFEHLYNHDQRVNTSDWTSYSHPQKAQPAQFVSSCER